MFRTLFLVLILIIKYTNQCYDFNVNPPKYYLTEKCYKSSLSVLMKTKFTTLSSCFKLGIEKKALALNFSPPEVDYLKDDLDPVDYTCEILKCAESDGGMALVNDTRFDYYSLYAKQLPHINSTCLPGIGMFFLLKKVNYTTAAEECKNMSGSLADVINERRTDAFAQLLDSSDPAFVDLRSDNGSEFVSIYGDKLDCTTFRAWAPGHPRKNRQKYDCVAVTKARTWLTLPCKTKINAICELNPSGPYKKGAFFATRQINVTNDEVIKN